MKTGKLVMVTGETTSNRLQAERDLAGLLGQDGMLGGAIVEDEERLGFGEYRTVFYAAALTVFDMGAAIPLGCCVASKKMSKRLGIKVPFGVDA